MKNITAAVLVLVTLLCTQGWGRILRVGPAQTLKTPSIAAGQAVNGDTVLIDSALYNVASDIRWSASNLLIRGVGGRPHLHASAPLLKGIFETIGSNITVENIEFSGAVCMIAADHNACGIRLSGAGLTIRRCFFHDNEDGIMGGSSGDVLVEYSEFLRNGHTTGQMHNIYIGRVNSFTLRHSYTHQSKIGHLVKSRAHTNTILYNRIMDEDSGTGSYQIDLPNGGTAYIVGNTIEQGALNDNPTFISYGREGFTNATPHQLYAVNNTFVNHDANGGIVRSSLTADSILLMNNLFVGPCTVGDSVTPVTGVTNLSILSPDDAGFLDAAAYDYRLLPGSPALNAGTLPGSAGSFNLLPGYQYAGLDTAFARPLIGAIDLGAFEYDPANPAVELTRAPSALSFTVQPNPFYSSLQMRYRVTQAGPVRLGIFNVRGQSVWSQDESWALPGHYSFNWLAGSTAPGTYILSMQTGGKRFTQRAVLVK